jgi:toxin ParE1/3/4
MAVVTRTDQAEDDLIQILDALGQRSMPAAQRLKQEIDRKCGNYAHNPQMGILRDDLAPNLRCFPVRGYIVFYRPTAGGIEVARVIRGSRNITPSLFAP